MAAKEERLLDHLVEFRRRLIAVLVVFGLTFLVSLYFSPAFYQFLTSNLKQKLLVLGPNDILWIYVSLASLASFSLILPFTCYQIWAYIKPALKPQEAKALLTYIPSVFACFVAGLAFGFYLVTPALLQVLLTLGEGLVTTQLTAQNYLDFVFHTTLPLAVLFEFPVLVAFFTQLGIIRASLLVTYRRHAYFSLICLAVMLTPADLLSDVAMSLPLMLIYEFGLIMSRLIEKKRGK